MFLAYDLYIIPNVNDRAGKAKNPSKCTLTTTLVNIAMAKLYADVFLLKFRSLLKC